MTKSVSRVLVVVVALAAMLSLFSAAEGQGSYGGDDPVIAGDRGSQFEPDPATANSGYLGFGDLNPQPSSDPAAAVAAQNAAAVGGTGGGLAVTGSETDLPLAIGIGLLAVGGTAVVASRKRDE